jgi:hypothetical protein
MLKIANVPVRKTDIYFKVEGKNGRKKTHPFDGNSPERGLSL